MDQINIAIITETHEANLILTGQNDISKEVWAFFSLFEYAVDYESHKISIYNLQTKTSSLLKNVLHFAEQIKQKNFWSFYKLLNEIKDGAKFYIFPISETLPHDIVHQLQMQLFELNNQDTKEFVDFFNKNLSAIVQEYQIVAYDNTKNVFIGEPDKNKRVCRYCGRVASDTSYILKAHTISEALGNKHIVTNDECDMCNGEFGRGIEQDLINYIQPLLTFYGVNGKNGIPKIKDVKESFSIENTKDNNQSKIEIKLQQKENSSDERWTFEEDDGTILLSFSGKPVNIQNVYRAIVKYAIGVMPDNQLDNFKDTIKWIRGDTSHADLPRVIFFLLHNIEQNKVGLKLFLRKTDNKELPYGLVSLELQGLCIMAILPLSSKDDRNFANNDSWNNFWNFIKPFYPLPVLKVLNPNKDTKEDMTFKFNFVQNK